MAIRYIKEQLEEYLARGTVTGRILLSIRNKLEGGTLIKEGEYYRWDDDRGLTILFHFDSVSPDEKNIRGKLKNFLLKRTIDTSLRLALDDYLHGGKFSLKDEKYIFFDPDRRIIIFFPLSAVIAVT